MFLRSRNVFKAIIWHLFVKGRDWGIIHISQGLDDDNLIAFASAFKSVQDTGCPAARFLLLLLIAKIFNEWKNFENGL